jgi:hypothetical protein
MNIEPMLADYRTKSDNQVKSGVRFNFPVAISPLADMEHEN